MELNREHDAGLTLAQHALQCSTAFHKYLAAPHSRSKLVAMWYQKRDFTKWTSAMEVFGPPEVSLDYRLRDSPEMVETIHQLFDVILHAITLKPVSAHPLQSEEPPTTKKRRLSESGRAEVDRDFDDPSEIDIGGGKDEINLVQIIFTIGGTTVHLWRLFHDIRLTGRSATRTLKPSWLAYVAQLEHRQSTRGEESPSFI